MSLFSIFVQTRWFHSSLWLNRTSLYVLNIFSLCLQAYLGWFSNLTIMSMAITQAGNYLYCFWLWFLLTFLFFKEAEFYLMIVLVPLLNFWEYNLITIFLFSPSSFQTLPYAPSYSPSNSYFFFSDCGCMDLFMGPVLYPIVCLFSFKPLHWEYVSLRTGIVT